MILDTLLGEKRQTGKGLRVHRPVLQHLMLCEHSSVVWDVVRGMSEQLLKPLRLKRADRFPVEGLAPLQLRKNRQLRRPLEPH